MSKLNYGDIAAREVSERIHAQVADLATLKSTPENQRVNGQLVLVVADQTIWYYDTDATLTGDDVLVVAPTSGTGRWLRKPGAAMLAIPFYATTPTGTNLLTIPTGCLLAPREFGYRVSRVFTGASNAAIAFSSSNHPGHTGPANFAGTLVATQLSQMFSATANGTGLDFALAPIGTTFGTIAERRTWMKPGDTIRADIIGAQFATGVAQLLLLCDILQNNGN